MSVDTISISSNEVSFFVTRAAVGVGVFYGVAEDFSKAVIWATRCGLDPAVAALSCLKRLDSNPDCALMTMIETDTKWIFRGKKGLSATYAATALTDFWPLTTSDDHEIIVCGVDNPLIVASALGLENNLSGVVEWPGVKIVFSENHGAEIDATDINSLFSPKLVDLKVSTCAQSYCGPTVFSLDPRQQDLASDEMLNTGIHVDEKSWRGIISLFERCLVTSNQHSQLSGAGAGLLDND